MKNRIARLNTGLPSYTYGEKFCHNCSNYVSWCYCKKQTPCEEGYMDDYSFCDVNCGINLKEVAETLVVNNSIELKLHDVKIDEYWYAVGDHIEIDDREVEITYELFYDLEVIAGLHNEDMPNLFAENDYAINFSELHAVIELKEKAKAKAVKAEFVGRNQVRAWYEQTR